MHPGEIPLNKNRSSLLDFQEVYPNTVREENADNIIALLREKKQQGLE